MKAFMAANWLAGATKAFSQFLPGGTRRGGSLEGNEIPTVDAGETVQSDFWSNFTHRAVTPGPGEEREEAEAGRILNMLVPIDFTESSLPALECAFNMARKERAHITLLHAINLNLSPRSPVDFNLIKQEMRRSAAARLSLIQGCAKHEKIETDFTIAEGKPAAVIENYLKENQTDLVILTVHKHGRLGGFLHPKTAEKTIRRANCPVLVINA
jgi:nucleotide-binding universal stress UspA family protein